MKTNVKVNIDTKNILKKRGLGSDKGAQGFLAETVAKLCDPYVPMQQGTLKNQVQVTDHTIEYEGPYAHYQYVGEVMAGRAKKHYTGKEIEYHGAPMRGKQWDKRMMADRKDDVEKALSKYIKERAH